MTDVNIYCDESCHLERDGSPVMVLGAVTCPSAKAREVADRIRRIKAEHGLEAHVEAKWVKVSPSKAAFFKALVDYFFAESDLSFRGVVVPDKTKLRHCDFGQTHDDFYYKMHYEMLKVLLDTKSTFKIFVDRKDSQSAEKVARLHEFLAKKVHDSEHKIVKTIDLVRSEQVQQIQLTDVLIGAIAYVNRNLEDSPAKMSVVSQMQLRSSLTLKTTTALNARKFNLLVWQAC